VTIKTSSKVVQIHALEVTFVNLHWEDKAYVRFRVRLLLEFSCLPVTIVRWWWRPRCVAGMATIQ